MTSRRQRQLAARKQPSTCKQDLARKTIFQKIDKKAESTENLIARLRARLEVLDLVVDKSLPEDAFLARKEMNPWLFRRNERLNNKWTFVNSMVAMQEFLVAASDARKRKDEAQAKSLQSDLQKTTLIPVQKSSHFETSSITSTQSKSRKQAHEADETGPSENAVVPNERFPKETILISHHYRSNQEARQETSNVSNSVLNSDTTLSLVTLGSVPIPKEYFPKDEIPDACLRSRTEHCDTVLQATMIDDSIVTADTNGKVDPEPSNKHRLSLTTIPPVNGISSFNLEFLNRNERKLNLRPSLKPPSFSKFRTMARELEKTLGFEWSAEPVTKICQYCSKSLCVGQQFKMYLAEKESRDTQPPQSQPSDRMTRRIADVTAIYALAYH